MHVFFLFWRKSLGWLVPHGCFTVTWNVRWTSAAPGRSMNYHQRLYTSLHGVEFKNVLSVIIMVRLCGPSWPKGEMFLQEISLHLWWILISNDLLLSNLGTDSSTTEGVEPRLRNPGIWNAQKCNHRLAVGCRHAKRFRPSPLHSELFASNVSPPPCDPCVGESRVHCRSIPRDRFTASFPKWQHDHKKSKTLTTRTRW